MIVPQRLDREQRGSRKVPNRKHGRRSWHGLSLHSPLTGESTLWKGLESPVAGGWRMDPRRLIGRANASWHYRQSEADLGANEVRKCRLCLAILFISARR